MPSLLSGEIAEELADGGVRRVARRGVIEAFALGLHQLCLGAHLLETQRTEQPERFSLQKALHILPADERNVIAEFTAVEVEKTMAVAVLFLGHGGEHPRRSRIVLAHGLGEIAISANVLFFQGNRQCQNLAFRKIFEVLLHFVLELINYHQFDKTMSLQFMPLAFM